MALPRTPSSMWEVMVVVTLFGVFANAKNTQYHDVTARGNPLLQMPPTSFFAEGHMTVSSKHYTVDTEFKWYRDVRNRMELLSQIDVGISVLTNGKEQIQHLYTGNACRKISLSQPSLLDNALIFNLLLHATPESSSADGMVVFKRSNYLGSKLRFDYRYYAYNTHTSIPKRIELTVFDESESEEFLSFSADFSQFVAGSHLPQVFQLPHHCDTYYNHLDLEDGEKTLSDFFSLIHDLDLK